jgi:regulatory protein YycH of two-component signal transduction system YycFG
VLESTRVVKKEVVADRKKASDVISPSQIVYQDGKLMYGIVGHSLLDVISSRLEASKFYYQRPNLVDFTPEDIKKPFIEIVFPVNMPSDVYRQLLHLEDPGVNRLSGVDRIIFYPNDSSVYLASYSERKMIKLGSTFPHKEIKDLMVQQIKAKSAVPFIKHDYVVSNENENQVMRRFYLPKNTVNVKSYKYLAQSITDSVYEKYKKALFPDPQSVKSGTTQNGQTFTDVSSALVINENVSRMKFTNFAGSTSSVQNLNPLMSSIDYINTHAGWGNAYFLSDLSGYQAVFYPQVRNLPILNSDMEMSLKWDENGDLYEYQRSLIELNDEGLPFNETPEVHKLQSGEAVAEELKMNYAPEYVYDVRIGFTMDPESDSQVYHLEPKWFILYGESKRWQPLFKQKGEF